MTTLGDAPAALEQAAPSGETFHLREVGLVGLAAVGAVAIALVTHRAAGDPFGSFAQAAALLVGGLVVAVVVVLAAFGKRLYAGGVGAVLVPCWIAFFCAWQLAGTPYAYGGIRWDIGRLSALATRFTVSTASADQFVPHLPSDYPILFPWVVGKTAVLTGVPAWRVLPLAGVVVVAISVTVGYLLWRRLLPPLLALAVTIVPLAYQGDPRKAFEVLALVVITPWILTVFGRWPEPRLHWLPAGVIGGLLVTDYVGYFVYTAAGVVAIVVMGLRGDGALRYLRHAALTVLVATVVSSWYLGPWMFDLLRHGGTNMWVYYFPAETRHNLLWLPWSRGPFISPLLIGGLVLMVVFCRRHAWARYLLVLALSATVYRWIWAVIHHYTGNSGILEYTGRVSDTVETIGFVLGVHQLWQQFAVDKRRAWPRLVPVLAPPLALLTVLGLAVGVFWQHQRVGAPGRNFAKIAHLTYLPDGSRTRYSQHLAGYVLARYFPARAVRDDVESVLGRNALPVTLTYDEEISAYFPFYMYVGHDRDSANSLSLYPRRAAVLRQLAQVQDPSTFAAMCAHSEFGPIDVFILQKKRSGALVWNSSLAFRSSQFAPADFVRFREANHTIVFVRRGARVVHHAYPR